MVSIATQDSWGEDRPTTLINPLHSCQMDMVRGAEVGASECIGVPYLIELNWWDNHSLSDQGACQDAGECHLQNFWRRVIGKWVGGMGEGEPGVAKCILLKFLLIFSFVLRLHCCTQAFSSYGEWGLLLLRSPGSRACELQQFWHMDLVALLNVESSWIEGRTRVPCTGRSILYHWATKEALLHFYLFIFSSF